MEQSRCVFQGQPQWAIHDNVVKILLMTEILPTVGNSSLQIHCRIKWLHLILEFYYCQDWRQIQCRLFWKAKLKNSAIQALNQFFNSMTVKSSYLVITKKYALKLRTTHCFYIYQFYCIAQNSTQKLIPNWKNCKLQRFLKSNFEVKWFLHISFFQ